MKIKGSRSYSIGLSVHLPLLVVPITASGLQGEQPLADRSM